MLLLRTFAVVAKHGAHLPVGLVEAIEVKKCLFLTMSFCVCQSQSNFMHQIINHSKSDRCVDEPKIRGRSPLIYEHRSGAFVTRQSVQWRCFGEHCGAWVVRFQFSRLTSAMQF